MNWTASEAAKAWSSMPSSPAARMRLRGLVERVEQGLDLLGRHDVRQLARELAHDLGRRPGRVAGVVRRESGRQVRQLDEHPRAVRVHPLGELPVARHDRVVEVRQEVHLRGAAGGMDRRRPRDAQRDAALRLPDVVGDLLIADQAVRVVGRRVTGADDAVPERERPDVDRTQQADVLVAHEALSPRRGGGTWSAGSTVDPESASLTSAHGTRSRACGPRRPAARDPAACFVHRVMPR